MFRKPDRYAPCSVPAPTTLHIGAYLTGGLKDLYHRISRGETIDNTGVDVHTNEKGQFRPGHDGPVVMAQRYYITEVLNTHGQSATLVFAEDLFRQNQVVVIKILHTSYFAIGAQEAECLRRLAVADPLHVSHTVKLMNTFLYGGHFCMVFESLCPLPITDLFEGIQLPNCTHLQKLKKLTLQLLVVLGFLRQQNTIHADLKPENILLRHGSDLNSVKVIDFGNSIQHVHKEVSLYYHDFDVQTLLYRAPEVIFGIPFGTEIDMWSLGCVLAELYLGRPLFFGKSKTEILTSITSVLGPLPREIFQRGKFSQELEQFTACIEQEDASPKLLQCLTGSRDYAFANFLAQLFRYDPDERLSPSEAAQHPFLAQELCIGFLLPNSTKRQQTSSIMLNSTTYKNCVKISSEVRRQNPSSYDLLRMGTERKFESCHYETKVAEVQPYKQELDTGQHHSKSNGSSRSFAPQDRHKANFHHIHETSVRRPSFSPYQPQHIESKHRNDSGFYEGFKSEEKNRSTGGRCGTPAFDLTRTLPTRSPTSYRDNMKSRSPNSFIGQVVSKSPNSYTGQVKSRSPLKPPEPKENRSLPFTSISLNDKRHYRRDFQQESESRNTQSQSPKKDMCHSRVGTSQVKKSFHSPVKIIVKDSVSSPIKNSKNVDDRLRWDHANVSERMKHKPVSPFRSTKESAPELCKIDLGTRECSCSHGTKACLEPPSCISIQPSASVFTSNISPNQVELKDKSSEDLYIESVDYHRPSSMSSQKQLELKDRCFEEERVDYCRSSSEYISRKDKQALDCEITQNVGDADKPMHEDSKEQFISSSSHYEDQSINNFSGKFVSHNDKPKQKVSGFSASSIRDDGLYSLQAVQTVFSSADLLSSDLTNSSSEELVRSELGKYDIKKKNLTPATFQSSLPNEQHLESIPSQSFSKEATSVPEEKVRNSGCPNIPSTSIPKGKNSKPIPLSSLCREAKSVPEALMRSELREPKIRRKENAIHRVEHSDSIPPVTCKNAESGSFDDLMQSPRQRKPEVWKRPMEVKPRRAVTDTVARDRKKLVKEHVEVESPQNRTALLTSDEDLSGDEARKIMLETTVRCESLEKKRDVCSASSNIKDETQWKAFLKRSFVSKGCSARQNLNVMKSKDITGVKEVCVDESRTVIQCGTAERKQGETLMHMNFNERRDIMTQNQKSNKLLRRQGNKKQNRNKPKQLTEHKEHGDRSYSNTTVEHSVEGDRLQESNEQDRNLQTDLYRIVRRKSSDTEDDNENGIEVLRIKRTLDTDMVDTRPSQREDQWEKLVKEASNYSDLTRSHFRFKQSNNKIPTDVKCRKVSQCIKSSHSPFDTQQDDTKQSADQDSCMLNKRKCDDTDVASYLPNSCVLDSEDEDQTEKYPNSNKNARNIMSVPVGRKDTEVEDEASGPMQPEEFKTSSLTNLMHNSSVCKADKESCGEQFKSGCRETEHKCTAAETAQIIEFYDDEDGEEEENEEENGQENEDGEENGEEEVNGQEEDVSSIQELSQTSGSKRPFLGYLSLVVGEHDSDLVNREREENKTRGICHISEELGSESEFLTLEHNPGHESESELVDREREEDITRGICHISEDLGSEPEFLDLEHYPGHGSESEFVDRGHRPLSTSSDSDPYPGQVKSPVVDVLSSPASDDHTALVTESESTPSGRSVDQHCVESNEKMSPKPYACQLDCSSPCSVASEGERSHKSKRGKRPIAKRQLKFATKELKKKMMPAKKRPVASFPVSPRGHARKMAHKESKCLTKDPYQFIPSPAKKANLGKHVASTGSARKPKRTLSRMKKTISSCKKNVVASRSRRKSSVDMSVKATQYRMSLLSEQSRQSFECREKRTRKGVKKSSIKSVSKKSTATKASVDCPSESDSDDSITSKVCVRKRQKMNPESDSMEPRREENNPSRNDSSKKPQKHTPDRQRLSRKMSYLERLMLSAEKITPRTPNSTPRSTRNSGYGVQAVDLDESIIFVAEKEKRKQTHTSSQGEGHSRDVGGNKSPTPGRPKTSVDIDDEEVVLLIS